MFLPRVVKQGAVVVNGRGEIGDPLELLLHHVFGAEEGGGYGLGLAGGGEVVVAVARGRGDGGGVGGGTTIFFCHYYLFPSSWSLEELGGFAAYVGDKE